jgi:hypothetical protein
MKISHRQLTECQRNPAEWVSNQVNQKEKFYRMGYKRCLREEIYRFHRHRDVKAARQFLRAKFLKHKLKNNSRIQETLTCLNAYINWFQNEGLTIAGSRVLLNFSLGQELTLGGIIPRIDVISQGYRAILLDEIPLQWKKELRMPLIQRGLARAYSRPEDEFLVGIQELDASDLAVTSYSKTDINHAEQIMQRLAEEVANELTNIESIY